MLAANRAELSIRKLQGHTGSVKALAHSPDRRTLASGGFDRTVRLWDVATGETQRVLVGHEGPVTSVAFSPDARWLATTSEDKTVRLWGLGDRPASEVVARGAEPFNAAAFSPDSQRLAIGGEDRRVWMLSLADRSLSSSAPNDGGTVGHTGPVYGVTFSPDGTQIVSASWDHSVRLWSADGGFVQLKTLTDHRDSVLAVQYSPDGKVLATASRDGTVLLYTADTAGPPIQLKGHEQTVYALDFSPDSSVLASGGTDCSVRLWLASLAPNGVGGANWRALVGLSYRGDHGVNAVSFLDDSRVAWAGVGGELLIRELDSSAEKRTEPGLTESIALLPDAGLLVEPNFMGFRLRRLSDLKYVSAPPALALVHVSASPDEQQLLGADFHHPSRALAVDLARPGEALSFAPLSGARIHATAYSPDGRWVAVGNNDGLIGIFDARTRELTARLESHTSSVFSVAFSPDGARLASGSYDKTVRLWDTTTWQTVRVLEGHEHGIHAVTFSPDGKLLASASWDRDARLWDVATGTQVAVLHGHLDQVYAVAFSPDGALLASAGWDGTVRLWSVRTHEELARFVSDEARVWSLLFGPDGKGLYYGGFRTHWLEFKALPAPAAALEQALRSSGFRLDGPNLVR